MIAVVIPAYRVAQTIAGVVLAVPQSITRIYVVDDACPEGSGDAAAAAGDGRVEVLRHTENMGVGGATTTGYRRALADGAEVVVKLDGDGQMPPALIPTLVAPLLDGRADYVKGNRFFDPAAVGAMPLLRLVGNTALSFITKLSTGYWNVMDPTNGFTAIHRTALERLPLERLDRRYFFESDVLFRLYTIRAVVRDVPMVPVYGDERSGLSVSHSALTFPGKHLARFAKRLTYSYLLRDFNVASLQLLGGSVLVLLGVALGVHWWTQGIELGTPTTSGRVMLAALPVLLGFQLLLAAAAFDVQNVPREPLQRVL